GCKESSTQTVLPISCQSKTRRLLSTILVMISSVHFQAKYDERLPCIYFVYLMPYAACRRAINPLSSSFLIILSSISSSTFMVSNLGLRGLSRRCVLRRPSIDGKSFLSSPVIRS